jgi:hypothetical protein
MAQEILPTLTPSETRALRQISEFFAVDPSMYRRHHGLALIERRYQKWVLTDAGKLKLSDSAGAGHDVQS